MVVNIAANYGGQWDILQATQALAEKVTQGELQPSDIDEDVFKQHLTMADLPDVDLLIRTSGSAALVILCFGNLPMQKCISLQSSGLSSMKTA